MDEWLHEPKTPTGAVFASVDFDWAEVFNPDFYVETFDSLSDFTKKVVSSSKILSEFEKSIIEIGTQTTAFIPQTRAIRVIGRLILVGKAAKLVLGTEEDGGPRKFIGIVDVDLATDVEEPISLRARDTFERLARQASVQYARAGWVVHDPVWLADPRL